MTPWTRSDIRRARQTPLLPVLLRLGLRVQPRRDGNHLITGLPQEIVVKDHYWIAPDAGISGNAIDFLMRIQRLSFNEALRLLLASDTQPTHPANP